MRKYIFIIIILLAIIAITYNCISPQRNNTTSLKTYDADGIYFNYPSSWFIITNNTTENSSIISIGDASFNNTNGTQGTGLTMIKIVKTANSTSELKDLKKQLSSMNGTNSTITLAGLTANETFSELSSNNTTVKLKFIDFQKNKFQYMIQYVKVSSDFQTQAELFDTITKSLKIQ